MVILKNIKYKNGDSAKLFAVKAYKEITGATLYDAKKFVEDAHDNGSITILDDGIGHLIAKEVFDCEIITIDDNPDYYDDDDDDEPSQETKDALAWYDSQLSFMRERIDLIVAFKQREMIPRG